MVRLTDKEYSARHYAKHREKILKRQAAWRADNPEKASKIQAAWYAKHRAERAAYREAHKALHPGAKAKAQAKYYDKNRELLRQKRKARYEANREAEIAQKVKYLRDNPHIRRAIRAKERAALANPKWADRKEIRRIYDNCPPGHHVDHIIPLRGKYVCGLHVPWNLQYLPDTENWRKGNRVDQDSSALHEDLRPDA